MKYLYFNIILILLAIGYSKGIEEGHVNSYYYPSNDNELRFNYPKLNNLIVFGYILKYFYLIIHYNF